jgi:hypothetical protein
MAGCRVSGHQVSGVLQFYDRTDGSSRDLPVRLTLATADPKYLLPPSS